MENWRYSANHSNASSFYLYGTRIHYLYKFSEFHLSTNFRIVFCRKYIKWYEVFVDVYQDKLGEFKGAGLTIRDMFI